MENLRAGVMATEIARPNMKPYSLPKPGDWFRTEEKQFVKTQSDDEIRSVLQRFHQRVTQGK